MFEKQHRLKILLTGKNGQVGWELRRTLAPLGTVIAVDRHQLNLTNVDMIRSRIREIGPNLIINAAAYTAVDQAEEEVDLARAINTIAPGILAEEAARLDAAIVHYSTDYVFDGLKRTFYIEEDEPNPLNVYGQTKLDGERAIQAVGVPHLILRTSWIYGTRGRNFLLTIRKLVRERKELRIVSDQIGAPTWSRMIAETTAQLLVRGSPVFRDNSGLYHLSAGGQTSWYHFAYRIVSQIPERELQTARLIPVPSSDYLTPARRPVCSLLSNARFHQKFGLVMPDWEQQLDLALDGIPFIE